MTQNDTLTKDMLTSAISSKLGLAVKDAKAMLELLLDQIKCALEKGEDVKISGFGKWSVNEKKTRTGRNPHTGEKIDISARRVVTFHAADTLRDKVNQQQEPA